MADVLHPALDDLSGLLCEELGAVEAARVLAFGGQGALENTLRNGDALRAAGESAHELLAARQLWITTWQALHELHPEVFHDVQTDGLPATGLAIAFALSRPGLDPLVLTRRERQQLNAGRRKLAEVTGLTALRRARPVHVITPDCLTLRHSLDLIAPGTIGMTVGGAASIGRPIIFTLAGVLALRQADAGISHLTLQVIHEEVHVALACAARPAAEGWSALGTAAEEAVVSALDLTADLWLSEKEMPTRRALIIHSDQGNYPRAVRGLLRRMPDADVSRWLARLGALAVACDNDEDVALLLNGACGTERSVAQWLRALPLP